MDRAKKGVGGGEEGKKKHVGSFDRNIWPRCLSLYFKKAKRPRDAYRGRIEDFTWTEIKNNTVRTHTLAFARARAHTHRHTRKQAGKQAGRQAG